jgi:hybrid cluster-associated redox disulfide protein
MPKKQQKITKKSNILETIQKYPEIVEVFQKHGFACVGCALAQFESIEQGAEVHGIDVDELVKELNKVIENKK